MTNRTAALGRSLAAVIMVLALGVSCSSSESASGTNPDGGGEATTTTTTTAPAAPDTTKARQPCSAATLGAAALASFEGPALLDVICEDAAAVATLSNGPGGELVLLFGLQDGNWVLVGNAPLDAAASAAPAGFSATAVPTWQRARDARLKRGSRTPSGNEVITDIPPSSLQVNPDTGETEVCVEESSDYIRCSPPSTAPPPPDDPDAPPVTTKQSGFCKYNYNDPRCVADPGFQP